MKYRTIESGWYFGLTIPLKAVIAHSKAAQGCDLRMWRVLRGFRRPIECRRGAALIEFAFTMPIITLMITGIIEFGMILFVQNLMEGGLRDASRYGITGQEKAGSSRLEQIKDIVEDRTIGLVDMSKADFQVLVYSSFGAIGQSEEYDDANGNGSYDTGEDFTDLNGNGAWDEDIGEEGPGGSGDIVVYRLSYDWNLLTPLVKPFVGKDGLFPLQASVAVRNEPWDVSGS